MGAEGRRRAQAFGLEIDLSFEAPGLPEATGPPIGRPTRADLVPPEEIDRDWPGGERVLEESFDGGEPARTIEAHPEAGYRLYARHFGLARLSPSGDLIRCAPPDDEPWSWQRFLVGRILPWAAVLRGLEAFHASAIAVDGRAIAFVGPTGAGKTSLAIQLAARGAAFLTDDVLALEQNTYGVVAHPGAAIASVRDTERETMAPDLWDGVGEVLGYSEKTYVGLERFESQAPLAGIYFLRGQGEPVERIESPDPRMLLASTFVLGVRTPERLRRQLDVCAHLFRSVPMFWLTVRDGSARLAEVVEEHAAKALIA
ncbi:MAG: hypothetical protein M3340_15790 [Actinomycetota bacterium]|nr:hypothetical protein [Actinomycetota bacterium]